MKKTVIILFIIGFVIFAMIAFAGNLEPAAPPGPTMHTLDEIYTKVDSMNNKAIPCDACDSCCPSCDPCDSCCPACDSCCPTVCEKAYVSKTGQTASYATGDDGDLEAGFDWPSPRFTDNLDGTVTDNLTGLMWLKDANCINTNYPSFDIDNIVSDGRVTWQHALDFVAGINSGTYSDCGCGYTDWRLSNRRELLSLIDDSRHTPALPSGHPFSGVQNDVYNSGSTYAYDTGKVWLVSMHFGYVGSGNKSLDAYVWPVRDAN